MEDDVTGCIIVVADVKVVIDKGGRCARARGKVQCVKLCDNVTDGAVRDEGGPTEEAL